MTNKTEKKKTPKVERERGSERRMGMGMGMAGEAPVETGKTSNGLRVLFCWLLVKLRTTIPFPFILPFSFNLRFSSFALPHSKQTNK